jgi:regulator of nonsense transcripts 1
VIFGNARVLAKHDLWNNLLNEFKFQNCLVEGTNVSTLKQCNMVLRRPVKYNPDKRDFILTENNLSNMLNQLPKKAGPKIDPNEMFETASDLSKTESQISYGNRVSQFGFTDMFG